MASSLADAPHSRPSRTSDRSTIGLLAGWGRFPLVIAEAVRARGYRVACAGVVGHADPRLAALCDEFRWVGLGRLGSAIRFFRRHGVRDATMAGKIHKVLLFRRWAWLHHLPDLRTLRRFYPHFVALRADRKDDTLLSAVVDEFASAGIVFGPATDFAPELLVRYGILTRCHPTAAQQKDIEFGWHLAKEMGRLDVGQTVVVQGRAALAIEAIEGTDQCIARAGTLGKPGFAVVKVAKPQQDMRFDVPTVGLGTLETMVRAGAGCLAVEAGRTILIDQPEVTRYADTHGIAIVALTDETTPG